MGRIPNYAPIGSLLKQPSAPKLRGTKGPRDRSNGHLAFLRRLPCCVCGSRQEIEAAHIRMGARVYGKPPTGLGEKPSDCWAVPLCAKDHRTGLDAQHATGEEIWWAGKSINPVVLALALWRATGNDVAGELIISELRRQP